MTFVDTARGRPRGVTPGAQSARHFVLAEVILCMPIIGVTILEKFALQIGHKEVSFGLPMLCGAMAAGVLLGWMWLNVSNVVAYSVMIVVLASEQIFTGHYFSGRSIALLAVIHAPYLVSFRPGFVRPEVQLRFYCNLMFLLSILGAIQIAGQLITKDYEYFFPVDTMMPTSLVLQYWNNLNQLGSTGIYKANGVFMAEPSELSQDLAIAVIIEFTLLRSFWNRLIRLMVLFGGMVVTFSGTGVVILGLVLPIFIIIKKRLDVFFFLLLLLVIGAAAAYFLWDTLHLEAYIERTSELSSGSTTSSGFARYIGGFYLFDQFLWTDVQNALFGTGSGGFDRYYHRAIYNVSAVTWVKIPFEYGLVGALFYFYFIYSCIFRTKQSIFLRAGMAVHILVNTPLVPFCQALIASLVLWAQAPEDKDEDHAEAWRNST
jgi:hypothetical protein